MESDEQRPAPESPTGLIVNYLELHAYITARAARDVCGCESSNAARWLLQALAQRGVLERDHRARRGPWRFTRGPNFNLWRDSGSRGAQPGIMAGPRPPARVLRRSYLR
jgi:hypothetical protein